MQVVGVGGVVIGSQDSREDAARPVPERPQEARGLQPRRRAMDLLIAATALAHDLVLLSNDSDLLWLSDVMDVRRPGP